MVVPQLLNLSSIWHLSTMCACTLRLKLKRMNVFREQDITTVASVEELRLASGWIRFPLLILFQIVDA